MANKPTDNPRSEGGAIPRPADPGGIREQSQETVSEENPAGFKNDPDDPTNPNEAIERSRRKLRPVPLIPPPDEEQ